MGDVFHRIRVRYTRRMVIDLAGEKDGMFLFFRFIHFLFSKIKIMRESSTVSFLETLWKLFQEAVVARAFVWSENKTSMQLRFGVTKCSS